MKITKPDITISEWEFSLPNDADTVAFFDPTLDDGGFAVARKADADLIQASEKMMEALIELVERHYKTVQLATKLTDSDPPSKSDAIVKAEKSLKEAGCTIHNS